jgi:hypothetical protein
MAQPAIAAFKDKAKWTLPGLDLLAPDLANAIRTLEGEGMATSPRV